MSNVALDELSFLIVAESFRHALFIALDANFRLKGRDRGTTYEDVTLSPGWAYFVETSNYLEYVRQFANQEEVCRVDNCIVSLC